MELIRIFLKWEKGSSNAWYEQSSAKEETERFHHSPFEEVMRPLKYMQIDWAEGHQLTDWFGEAAIVMWIQKKLAKKVTASSRDYTTSYQL